ncbi:hypothetical protein [Streptomyces sp. NPDC007369]|uniref:hypothetical protein n=1 Tax=Streptomyces sp. NPDC007369 TaxID=3154589 RepID=UPI0033F30D20
MQRTSVDGVTVLWTPAPGPRPLTAQLTFGCGVRDESAPTMGVTRLVQGLVMDRVGGRLHEFGSVVDTEETRFVATGTPQDVAGFLEEVCRALSDLPLQRTGHVAGLLEIQDAPIPEWEAAEALGARFGPHGPGLVLHHHGGMYASVTADMVRSHAAARFTRGNAVLALDGPVPRGLRLPLPDGSRPERPAPRNRLGQSWRHRPVANVALLSTSGASSPAAVTAHMVLRRRVERAARDEQGISSAVSSHYFVRDRITFDRVLVMDAQEGREDQAAGLLWHEAVRLTRTAPAEAELAEFTARVRAEQDFEHGHWGRLSRAVCSELFGVPYLDDRTLLERLEAVTPEDVRRYMAQAMDDAVLVVPDGVHLRLRTPDGRAALPNSDCWRTEGPPTAGTVFPMQRLHRATTRRGERGEWVLTPWGLVCRDAHADEHDIRFDEVALMLRDGEERVVLTGCGCLMHLRPRYFRRGSRLTAAIDAAVPAARVRDPAAR